jgi:hypothetical protein
MFFGSMFFPENRAGNPREDKMPQGCRRFEPVTAYHGRPAACARIKQLITRRSQ